MTDMLQKSENVAKNVANENSQDLTSQWKKGELPEGWYWVKRVTWSECINMLYNWSDTFLDGDVPVDNDEITEVLAPVPSYEEYLSLTYAKEEDEKIIAEYEEENAQLKDLLEECRSPINYALCLNLSEEEKIEFRNLLSKIKRALGEDK